MDASNDRLPASFIHKLGGKLNEEYWVRRSLRALQSLGEKVLRMKAKVSIDKLSITTLRILAADIVQKANSGHPGAPMGCAPMAHILFSRFIKCSAASPTWVNT